MLCGSLVAERCVRQVVGRCACPIAGLCARLLGVARGCWALCYRLLGTTRARLLGCVCLVAGRRARGCWALCALSCRASRASLLGVASRALLLGCKPPVAGRCVRPVAGLLRTTDSWSACAPMCWSLRAPFSGQTITSHVH